MAYTTINKSTDYFNTKLYTGNESTRSETGVGFQPDFTWIKVRSRADPHILTDAVRGTSSQLSSDTTGAQQTFSNMITSFNSDGFSLGANVDVNRNSETFASWNWKAGGGQGSSNTDGSINTTYTSVNTTAGFSISQYTGTGSNATVGHGLGVAPNMVLVKSLSGGGDWTSYHSVLGNTKYMRLNSTNAVGTQSSYWNDTSPTSTVFSLGSAGDTNTNNGTHVAYCFADVTGYSKFGSYTGNNNSNGTFVYTGFKPAFLLLKDSQSGQYWHMLDNKREPFNDNDAPHLSPNNSGSEATIRTDRGIANLDFLSNGFKFNTDNSGFNGTNTYIYMAFGQSIVGSNNIPATAR